MATSSPRPRWQRLEADERRGQILAVARRLFAERTYASVSTVDIAREAGVARGLINHYFGTKRELYLEVVRSLVRVPASPIPVAVRGGDLRGAIAESAEKWLDLVERNRGMWLALVGAEGVGRDAEVEAILDDARERAAARLIEALGPGTPPSDALRAIVRAYGGMAEAASVQWLGRGRLTRAQVHALLVEGFLACAGEIRTAVEGV